MSKNVLFLLKNCKNRRAPPNSLASGGWGLRPQIPKLAPS